ncbi:MAG: hypothetical protein AMQ22_02196 [Candidatus Methanofastidiosum methylothiophilum]|jgi:hypothetical protein|uniref:Uncharacterized protein n=1 Tax=Candidatus Methanofastidiosum methylothiophilum TaxID=1705564 RepID=A0A150IL13_9EURY|nr:MAG: hypothetical protein AMQ22_02196 [Candidatus Methanofastidiosum methylthiophilus]
MYGHIKSSLTTPQIMLWFRSFLKLRDTPLRKRRQKKESTGFNKKSTR